MFLKTCKDTNVNSPIKENRYKIFLMSYTGYVTKVCYTNKNAEDTWEANYDLI